MQGMVKLVETTCHDHHSLSYFFNTRYVLGLGDTVVNRTAHYIPVFLIWNDLGPWVLPIYFQVQGKKTAPVCPFVQSLQRAHILLPSQAFTRSVMGTLAQQSSPGKLTAQLSEVSISS